MLELRRLGHDVLTVSETGKSDRAWPDKEVLNFAHSQDRAVLTLNRRHFIHLHEMSPDHSGIVTCTFDRDFSGQATRIHAAVMALSGLAGQLVRVNRPTK